MLSCLAAETNSDPAELARELTAMETKMKSALESYRLPSEYRKKCADHKQHDRAIHFFQGLVAVRTNNWQARLELSCAYVDKIPTCTGMTAMINRGDLAQRSLDQLNALIVKHPDLWVAQFARGLNHLLWPRAFRHSGDAVKDLSRCVEMQEKRGGQGGASHTT